MAQCAKSGFILFILFYFFTSNTDVGNSILIFLLILVQRRKFFPSPLEPLSFLFLFIYLFADKGLFIVLVLVVLLKVSEDLLQTEIVSHSEVLKLERAFSLKIFQSIQIAVIFQKFHHENQQIFLLLCIFLLDFDHNYPRVY